MVSGFRDLSTPCTLLKRHTETKLENLDNIVYTPALLLKNYIIHTNLKMLFVVPHHTSAPNARECHNKFTDLLSLHQVPAWCPLILLLSTFSLFGDYVISQLSTS
jgi:hypothetical protein